MHLHRQKSHPLVMFLPVIYLKYSQRFYASCLAKDLAMLLFSLSVGTASTSADSSSPNGKALHCTVYEVKKFLICYGIFRQKVYLMTTLTTK